MDSANLLLHKEIPLLLLVVDLFLDDMCQMLDIYVIIDFRLGLLQQLVYDLLVLLMVSVHVDFLCELFNQQQLLETRLLQVRITFIKMIHIFDEFLDS